MKPFSLFTKPAFADDNQWCEYGFYLYQYHCYPEPGRQQMRDELLERRVMRYMAASQPVYTFGRQDFIRHTRDRFREMADKLLE